VELLHQQAKPQTAFTPMSQVTFFKAALVTAEKPLAALIKLPLVVEERGQTEMAVMGVILALCLVPQEEVEAQMAGVTDKMVAQQFQETEEQVVQ
jgi:hypothetical protein